MKKTKSKTKPSKKKRKTVLSVILRYALDVDLTVECVRISKNEIKA